MQGQGEGQGPVRASAHDDNMTIATAQSSRRRHRHMAVVRARVWGQGPGEGKGRGEVCVMVSVHPRTCMLGGRTRACRLCTSGGSTGHVRWEAAQAMYVESGQVGGPAMHAGRQAMHIRRADEGKGWSEMHVGKAGEGAKAVRVGRRHTVAMYVGSGSTVHVRREWEGGWTGHACWEAGCARWEGR